MSRRIRSKKDLALFTGIMALGVVILGFGLGGLWYYTSESYMVMAGEEQVTIGLNGVFDDPGVEAKISGRDVTAKVDVQSDLDVSRPGEYTITYTAGNFHESRQVTVLDRMSPELELEGDDVTMLLGEEYKEPGYHAKATDGTDLTGQVKVSRLDYRRAGKKTLTYTVTDGEGNATRLTRKVTIQPNTKWDSPGLPICMFHYVYDENDPPDDLHRRYGNYISAQALTEEINWLKSENYYFPSWKEVRDYADGKLMLPDKSVVLTFDDGEKATLKQLIPIVEACRVPVTSFLITSKKGEKKVKEYVSPYLIFQSHTHELHRAGGVPGHKGAFAVVTEEERRSDLEKSIEVCGSRDAFAYPYGDWSESAEASLKEEGFLCAVTTWPGKVYPGDDPLRLNRQRMFLGQGLGMFQSKVAPARKTTP
ncbi:MAG: DUF5011 domain-containing protein [Firmicutes bacterium]|nr:DUF5011 domain-containing protein [Bacillota bacterium]